MKEIGIQLFSYTKGSDLDFLQRIKKSGEIGYTFVEFAGGYEDLPVETVKQALKDAGVTVKSAHVQLRNLDRDLPYLAELGVQYILVPIAPFCNKEEAKELADDINAFGEKCAKYGIKTGFHNHRREFTMCEGKALLEWLIEFTNPETVVFELDCGWCEAAGWNAVDFINKHAGRIGCIHVRENSIFIGTGETFSRNNPVDIPNYTTDENGNQVPTPEFKALLDKVQETNVAQGTGTVDWKAVQAAADAQYKDVLYIVERDASYKGPNDKVECLKEDATWLRENL